MSIHAVALGRKPNQHFDSAFCLKQYEDVRNSLMNPLVHYVQYGVHEQRAIGK